MIGIDSNYFKDEQLFNIKYLFKKQNKTKQCSPSKNANAQDSRRMELSALKSTVVKN